MPEITRHKTGPRMSQIVLHQGTVYLAGQVGTPGDSVADQTRECLDKVEALLAEAAGLACTPVAEREAVVLCPSASDRALPYRS